MKNQTNYIEIKSSEKNWLNDCSKAETLKKRGFDIQVGLSMYSLFVAESDFDRVITFY